MFSFWWKRHKNCNYILQTNDVSGLFWFATSPRACAHELHVISAQTPRPPLHGLPPFALSAGGVALGVASWSETVVCGSSGHRLSPVFFWQDSWVDSCIYKKRPMPNFQFLDQSVLEEKLNEKWKRQHPLMKYVFGNPCQSLSASWMRCMQILLVMQRTGLTTCIKVFFESFYTSNDNILHFKTLNIFYVAVPQDF